MGTLQEAAMLVLLYRSLKTISQSLTPVEHKQLTLPSSDYCGSVRVHVSVL